MNNRVTSFPRQAMNKKKAIKQYERGLLLSRQGKFTGAEKAYRKAIQIDPDFGEAYNNLGNVLLELGRLVPAIEAYKKGLVYFKDHPLILNNLGNALQKNGQTVDSIKYLTKAVQQQPDFADAYVNLGNAYKDYGDFDKALDAYDSAISVSPEMSEAHSNRGALLNEAGNYEAALDSLSKATELNPDNSEACVNRGNVLKELGRFGEALSDYEKAIQLKPGNSYAYVNRGNALKEIRRFEDAFENYEKAIELEPDNAEAFSNYLFTLNYSPTQGHRDSREVARKFANMVSKKVSSAFSKYACSPVPERLRVGLVSGDFRNHPVGYFLESVLACIDSSKIELLAYPANPHTDDLTERLKSRFADWTPIHNLDDVAAARLIHKDGVHILVDLSGHTSHNRLPLFAWKPAPIQVSWLGYFATTGLNEMDYLLGDPYATPPEIEDQFTEEIWRLPETRWCFTEPVVEAEIEELPALDNGYVTFGCFNNLTKLNDETIALWSRVLESVPESRVMLKTRQLCDETVRSGVVESFAMHGIGDERIILENAESRENYFKAYNKVDIALDPFPFTGGATTVEGLWMGVPIITLAGESLVSRQGVSILENAGLSDWIGGNKDDYINKAVQMSADLEKLSKLRNSLRARILSSPLFDAQRFANYFEDAFWQMWRNRQAAAERKDRGNV